MPAPALLLTPIRSCTLCVGHLPLGLRPVVGQTPGKKVHKTGIPFNDSRGERLRAWMGVAREVCYDPWQVALVPMGFCYPGRGKAGDVPPRPEGVAAWRAPLLAPL